MNAAEAATNHREAFTTWRERPAEFNFDGRYPLLEVFDRAAEAWKGQRCMQHICTSQPCFMFAEVYVQTCSVALTMCLQFQPVA